MWFRKYTNVRINGFVHFVYFFSIASSIWSNTEGRRLKRVLNGEPIPDRNAPYRVISYYVWIGIGRDIKYDPADILPRTMQPQRQLCGGALLTPKIVQSACHCFVDYIYPRDDTANPVYEWAMRNHLAMEAVVGVSMVDTSLRPVPFIKYQIHPLCANVNGHLSYDFTLLVMKTEAELNSFVRPAPVYSMADMALMWHRFFLREVICLLVGFGRYMTRGESLRSEILRHSWMASKSYHNCYKEYLNERPAEFTNQTDFEKFATWTCYYDVGGEKFLREGKIGKGDSGTPVTCENMYFSLVSEVGKMNTIVFYLYANSIDFRGQMIHDLLELDTNAHVEIKSQPDDRFSPEIPPPNYFAVVSAGPPIIGTAMYSFYPVISALSFLNQCNQIVLALD